jgi:hypothetical protein
VLRQNGYGGRNDQISKYMQSTFQSHIAARKKLLQEVMSKGKASAAVLEAAFDESANEIPGKPRGIRASGEFSIAFKGTRGSLDTPTSGHRVTRQFGSVTIDEETSSVRHVLDQRRESQEMMAEGTPHSVVTNLPKRVTKQMFAEATPVETDPDAPPFDPEAYDRGKYPRADTRATTEPKYQGETGAVNALVASLHAAEPQPGESDAAVLAMVASLEPQKSAPLSARPAASFPPPMREEPSRPNFGDIIGQAVIEPRKRPSSNQVPNVIERREEPSQPAMVGDEPEEASRPSQRMSAMPTPRPTSRKLEVVKPPTARVTNTQPIAVVVEPKVSKGLLIAIAVFVLMVAAMLVVITQL